MESAGDVTLIARELYDILDITPPKVGEAVDYYKLFDSATDRQFNAAVRRVRNRALRQRSNIGRIALNSGIKGGLFGLAFGADIAMGAGYFGWSVLSRHTRISQQTRRAANISYAAVLRRQAQASMIRAAGDPSAIRAAQSKMTDADFIEQLARQVPEARLAQNQFEAAERLMANAGFPSLRLGGANLRNAFGDDPNFIEQWRGFVSASKARDSLLAGAHRASRRELEEFYSVDWKRWDILDTKTVDDALFAEKWSRMMDLYTGNPIANEFYEIVWSNAGTATERANRLADLVASNEKVFNDLFAPQSIDDFSEKELFNAAKYVIDEYDNVLPPEYFATLRERAMTGKVEWPEIDGALNDIVDSANAMLPAGGEQATRKTIIEAIRDGGGDPNAPVYPHFGKSLGPDPASHANVQKVHDARLFGRGFVDRVYNMLGTMPTDNIARMPFFRANYELEAARRIDLLPVDADGKVVVTQRQLNEIGEGSRKFALKETRTILYDLAENLRMSELMGNTVAFLNAYAEVFSRWAGFAIRQPAEVMGKFRLYNKAWEAEALGLTEVEDPESGRTYLMFSLNQEDPTVFDALPQALRDQIVPPFLESGTIRMSKDGLNTALQGTLPGFGPVATVVMRETMREVPQLEEVMGFMFPFGHPDGGRLERSTIGNLAAWQKSAYNLLRSMGGPTTDENDEIVGRMMLDIYTQAQLDGTGIDLGDREEFNAWIDEANKRARQFNIFRIYQGLLAPSSTTILSPYHEFIEIARDLQREHGQREGTRRFLDEHGMDFFALTQRMTRLNDGTAASLQSELLFEQNQELVQAYPEIGAWITGSIGGSGEEYMFSTHVYWRQKTMGMGAGSDANRREVLTPRELGQQLSVSRGWYEFFELQEWEREERGKIYAAGLEGPGATFEYENGVRANPVEVLSAFKQDQIRKLERAYPDWSDEYNNLGSSMSTRRAINKGFAAVLQDETLSQRPSADHILEYYQLRYWMQEQLTARKREGGSDNIETSSNADLLRFWLNQTEQLGNRPGFSHVYDRFFERDRLLPQTFLDPADFGGLLEYRGY